ASAGATRFLGGAAPEMATAAVIGLVIGLLALGVGRFPATARLFEPACAMVAALLAAAAAALAGPLSIHVATLGGLIVLVPGLTLTIALNELATRNLVAGTARLVGAAMTFLGIGFGLAVGMRAAALLLPRTAAVPTPVAPAWSELVALAVTPLALTVLFRARPRDAGWVLLSGVLAYGTARIGSGYLGPELATFVAALLVAIGSNLYARRLRRPAAVPLVPGIMLLVPGSIGFRSVTELLAQDVVSGMQTAFAMILVGVALVTGLLLADVILSGDRGQRSHGPAIALSGRTC
ncbi:MAG: threonine/serine exporter family protein, partial [Planctomycetota bacterium]